ncbi:unnamed protein product [Somion occarium]
MFSRDKALSPGDIWLDPIIYTTQFSSSLQSRIWELLFASSVEAISSNRAGILDFAQYDCIYSATVNLVTEVVEEDEDIMDENDASHAEDARKNDDASEHTLWEPLQEGDKADKATPPNPIIGFVYLASAQYPGSVNLGIVMLPEFRHKGYGTRAARQLLTLAFAEFQCRRVQVQIGVAEKIQENHIVRMFTTLGFAHEGVNRRCLLIPSPFLDERQVGVREESRHVIILAMLDMEWVVLSNQKALPVAFVKTRWDEMFRRHQRERDCMLAVEEKADTMRKALRRTSSMETVKDVLFVPIKAEAETTSLSIQANSSSSPSSSSISRASDPVPEDDAQKSHTQVSYASTVTTNDDIQPPVRYWHPPSDRGTSVDSLREGSGSPELSDAEFEGSYASSPPRSPLSFAVTDSGAESDWDLGSNWSGRASQSESDWDMWETYSDISVRRRSMVDG